MNTSKWLRLISLAWLFPGLSLLLVAAEVGQPRPMADEEFDRMFQRIDRREKIETDTLLRALICNQTTLRAEAARLLGETGDISVVPSLITALSDESTHEGAKYSEPGMYATRWWANESLKKLTKQDFGFRWNAPKVEREAAINKWKQWWAKAR